MVKGQTELVRYKNCAAASLTMTRGVPEPSAGIIEMPLSDRYRINRPCAVSPLAGCLRIVCLVAAVRLPAGEQKLGGGEHFALAVKSRAKRMRVFAPPAKHSQVPPLVYGPRMGCQVQTTAPRLLPSLPPATSTMSTAAGVARSHRTSLIHSKRTTIDVGTIEFLDGIRGFLLRRHFNKTKAFAAPSVAIGDDPRRFHLACLAKHLSQAVVGRGKRQISNIQFVAHIAPSRNVIIV